MKSILMLFPSVHIIFSYIQIDLGILLNYCKVYLKVLALLGSWSGEQGLIRDSESLNLEGAGAGKNSYTAPRSQESGSLEPGHFRLLGDGAVI